MSRPPRGRLIIPSNEEAERLNDPWFGGTHCTVRPASGGEFTCPMIDMLSDDRRHHADGDIFGDVVTCPTCAPLIRPGAVVSPETHNALIALGWTPPPP